MPKPSRRHARDAVLAQLHGLELQARVQKQALRFTMLYAQPRLRIFHNLADAVETRMLRQHVSFFAEAGVIAAEAWDKRLQMLVLAQLRLMISEA